MSSTAIVKNKETNSLTIVTGVTKSATFREFVETIPDYFPLFAEELGFSVVAIIDTDNDPLVQTFDNIQSMSMKNFFKSLSKMGNEFIELASNSSDIDIDDRRQIKIGLANLERDINLKFY
ncbi:hypothetical protein SP15_018 [Bacillus phage SP-15]|uniref:Uncharacterized protein n=1 Tax=Bacillus phage SP-15 TaxID=1792032 RepID=A0A127AW64_9CAUD|nr:hypothetical protein SP15_018 [Bacillus phage SP-15]AMM44817.1 hypothetical protein SP15_018 [Bacillus phage SP-15]